jgi:NAD(P)-dependent dehydrogenase (short-subunit alcohol dehydrogenase family)
MASTCSQKYNKLANKHVLIIGGSSGIGYAVAEASLSCSASVTISSSSVPRIESAIASLQSSYPGSDIRGFPCDLSNPSLEQDITHLFENVGRVDHIVFTAGDPLSMIPLEDATLETIQRAGQVRFFAPLLVAKVGRKYLGEGPECSIIITTGSVAEQPRPNWSIVAAYASGLHGMVRNLALDLKPIRVNLVQPGALNTPLWRMADEEKEEMFKVERERVPTGRVAGPEEVAEAYLWLMKDWNVTGTVATSDSGSHLV